MGGCGASQCCSAAHAVRPETPGAPQACIKHVLLAKISHQERRRPCCRHTSSTMVLHIPQREAHLWGAAHRLGMCKQRVLASCASSGANRRYSLQPSPCWEATCSDPTPMRLKKQKLLPCAASIRLESRYSRKTKHPQSIFSDLQVTGRPCWRGTLNPKSGRQKAQQKPTLVILASRKDRMSRTLTGREAPQEMTSPTVVLRAACTREVSPGSLAPIRAHCWCVQHAAWTQKETESEPAQTRLGSRTLRRGSTGIPFHPGARGMEDCRTHGECAVPCWHLTSRVCTSALQPATPAGSTRQAPQKPQAFRARVVRAENPKPMEEQ